MSAVITDIKQLKRRNSRFSVYVDGKYAFTIGDLELSAEGLVVGQELSPEELESLKERGGQSKALDMAIRFVTVRPRSRKEITDYLARKGVEDQPASEVLDRLEVLGLADDISFAQGWVAGRQISRPRSRRKLEQELAAKGVSRADISSVLEAGFDENSEINSLKAVVEKKQRLPQYQDTNKLTAYLLRQGYPYELVRRALGASEF